MDHYWVLPKLISLFLNHLTVNTIMHIAISHKNYIDYVELVNFNASTQLITIIKHNS
jgi:hypothetical protein